MNIDEMKDRIARAEEIQRYTENRCEALEKENAELKADNIEWEKASDKWKSLYESTNKQLTKAKEIIKEFMKYEINEYDGSLEIHFEELKKQAEQFLKESE